MNSDFKTITIGDLCDARQARIQTGPFGSQLHAEEYVEGGVPVVPTEAILNGRIDHSRLPSVDAAKAESLNRHALLAGDILFARRGAQATGRSALVTPNENGFLCGTGCIRLRIESDVSPVSPRYLAYVLADAASIKWFKNHAIGATMPNLNEGIVRSFSFAFPNRVEQDTICEILESFDRKIHLDSKMDRTLEAISHAVFKSWFVDFEPVRAKINGATMGLPSPVLDCFPSDFDENGVPLGWQHKSIRDLTSSIQYGLTTSAVMKPTESRFLRITDIQGGHVAWESVPFCNASAEERKRYKIVPGDVLVARTGASTGENIYISHSPEAVFASYLVRFQFATRPLARYVGSFMRTRAYFEFIAGVLGGSAQPNASAQALAGVTLLEPPAKLLEAYYDFVAPIDDRIYLSDSQNVTLSELRDSLIAKLTSGKLSVADADQALEMSA